MVWPRVRSIFHQGVQQAFPAIRITAANNDVEIIMLMVFGKLLLIAGWAHERCVGDLRRTLHGRPLS